MHIAKYKWGGRETILEEWRKGCPWLPTSWFVVTILVYYMLFYLSALLLKKSRNVLICLWAITIIYMATLHYYAFSSFWYESIPSFNLGMTIAYNESLIMRKLESCWKFVFYSLIACFLILFLGDYFLQGEMFEGYRLSYIFQSISISLIIWLLVTVKGFPEISFLTAMGRVSYEIYLIQGAVIFILLDVIGLYPIFYAIATFVVTIILAYGLHYVSMKF